MGANRNMKATTLPRSPETLLAELQAIPEQVKQLASQGDSKPILALKQKQSVLPYELAAALVVQAEALEPMVQAALQMTKAAEVFLQNQIAEYERLQQEARAALPAAQEQSRSAAEVAQTIRQQTEQAKSLLIETASETQPEHLSTLEYLTTRLPELRAVLTAT
jgi:hypothetical protein